MVERWVLRNVERAQATFERLANAAERLADSAERDESMNTEISTETKEVALRELNILIDTTEDEEPDPLQDDVFQARDELREEVEG